MSRSQGYPICKKCKEYPAYLNEDICLECISKEQELAKQEERKTDSNKYMKQWGFPKRFLEWKRELLLPQYQKMMDSGIKKNGGLYIYGGAGTGKTCFATVFARELIQQGLEVWFKNVSDLLFEVKSTFDKDSKMLNDYDLICSWAEKPTLILDDLGSEKISEYVRQSLYVLINKRYLNDLPTIITSNLTLKELGTRLDDRISSRLSEMCEVFDLGNKDLRVYRGK